MSPAQAVELAYRIAEHGRATTLLKALTHPEAVDCTLVDFPGIFFNVNLGGPSTRPAVPHMLIRHMFQRGILRAEVRAYRDQLGESIAEEFGIIIEDDPDRPEPEQHQGSNPE